MLLGYASEQTAHANPIGTHHDRPFGAVRGQVSGPQCGRVLGAQLEDIADLDGALRAQRRPAFHTRLPIFDRGHVGDVVGFVVPADVDVA